MTGTRRKGGRINLQEIVNPAQDSSKELLRPGLPEVLEEEMTDAIGVEKEERCPGRPGDRAGYSIRSPVMRVGKLELEIPHNRQISSL